MSWTCKDYIFYIAYKNKWINNFSKYIFEYILANILKVFIWIKKFFPQYKKCTYKYKYIKIYTIWFISDYYT